MGFIKAAVGAAGGQLADQWRELFACDSLSADVLVSKGEHRKTGRSSNKKGEDNVITEGSIIVVADGQCAICVEQGAIVDIAAEPGEFTWSSAAQPSIFYGDLGEKITASFEEMGRRFGFGGQPGVDQRIYYVNTKELTGNKYGTTSPVPFRIIDKNIGLDMDTTVRCNGEYSYRITDPIRFYKGVAGNVEGDYTRDMVDSQLRTELLTALQPAFGRLAASGVRYSEIPLHTEELAQLLNDELSEKWGKLRGIEVISFGVNSINLPQEIEAKIAELQAGAVMANPNMAAAQMAAATADSMRSASKNESGAMNGFVGMGIANNFGGNQVSQLFAQAAQQQQNQPQQIQQQGAWQCQCGNIIQSGGFCNVCGSQKPSSGWQCQCGNVVQSGNFCNVCGAKRQ